MLFRSVLATCLGECISGSCSSEINVKTTDLLYSQVGNAGRIFAWDVYTNGFAQLNVPFALSGNSSVQIAHTSNKLWVSSASTSAGRVAAIREWDITLSPFSATYSKDIIVPGPALNLGLFALDNNTLVVTSGSTSKVVFEVDVSGVTPLFTPKITFTGTPYVQSLVVTDSNKLICIVQKSGNWYIEQYDYITGNQELSNLTSGFNPKIGRAHV